MENNNIIGSYVSALFVGVGYVTLAGVNPLGAILTGVGVCGILFESKNIFSMGIPKSIEYKPVILKPITLLLGKCSYFNNLTIPFDKNNSALLIAGKKGSGKSTLLKCILENLFYNTYNIEYYFLDLKMVELARYRNRKRVKYSNSNQEGEKMLLEIRKKIDDRNQLFLTQGVVDIDEFNSIGHEMAYILLVIEEIVILDKPNKKILDEILSIGRSAGVLVILTTQRPDSNTCSSFTKAQMDYIVGLAVTDEINSRVIGIEGLEKIEEKGRAKLLSDKVYDFQSFYLKEGN